MTINDSGWVSVSVEDDYIYYDTGEAWTTSVIDTFYIRGTYSNVGVHPWADASGQGMICAAIKSGTLEGNDNEHVFFYRPTGSSYTHGQIIRRSDI